MNEQLLKEKDKLYTLLKYNANDITVKIREFP